MHKKHLNIYEEVLLYNFIDLKTIFFLSIFLLVLTQREFRKYVFVQDV